MFLHVQIVGHSLGGGTAALLTYILREQKELSSSTCVAFAPGMYNIFPHNNDTLLALHKTYMLISLLNDIFTKIHRAAACMTWDLAESGKHFTTTIINGSDLVPTFSAASVDDLRSEVL